MRLSADEHNQAGQLVNGFDYDLQVWVKDGIVQLCGHPESMRTERVCCNQFRYEGMTIQTARRLHADPKGGR